MIQNETCRKIEALLKQRNWSLYRLATESGLAYSSISNLFHRNTEPTLPTLRSICKGLGISLSEFFSDEPGPLRSDYTKEEQKLIISYRSLKCADRRLLNTYISGLCKKLPDLTEQ